jgi:hypothetical protein
MTDVSEERTASIYGVVRKTKQAIKKKQNTGCGISHLTAAHFVGGHILGN